MKKWILNITLFLGVSFLGFGQMAKSVYSFKKDTTENIHSEYYADSLYLSQIKALPIKDLELPMIGKDGQFIVHSGFSLLYDESHEQACWVAYELTKAETATIFKRTNKFISDPMVATGSATNVDYAHCGYDRGHLAPAGDMGWSATTTAESFYYSNMSPQVFGFNRGIWKQLEKQVRNWAIKYGEIYVVTGPILTEGLPTIGPDGVSVPKYYYKVILEYNANGVKGIGFVLTNASSTEPLANYAVSIDIVEELTGIDFFPLLTDEQEAVIERTVCLSCWGLR
jgi:endonuclease G